MLELFRKELATMESEYSMEDGRKDERALIPQTKSLA
jgi:hypothetical protein